MCRRSQVRVLGVLGALVVSLSAAAFSQAFLTKESALEAHFPNSKIERKTAFLSENDVEKIQETAKSRVQSRVITYYVGKDGDGKAGYAFFDTHIVRTMPATIMIVLNRDSTVRAVELLAFYEPEDYKPSEPWLGQFAGKSLKSDLWLKRGIRNIVGATLSAQSITDAVRVMLAVYQTAVPKE